MLLIDSTIFRQKPFLYIAVNTLVINSVPFSKRNGKHNHEIQLFEVHGMVHIHDTKYLSPTLHKRRVS